MSLYFMVRLSAIFRAIYEREAIEKKAQQVAMW